MRKVLNMLPLFLTEWTNAEKDELENYLQQTLELKKKEYRLAKEQYKFFNEVGKTAKFTEGIFEVFNNLKDAIVFIDEDMKLRWVNTAAEEIFKKPKEELLDKECFILLGRGFEQDTICDGCLVKKAIEERKTLVFPCWTSPLSNNKYSVIVVPFFNGITGCIKIITPITTSTDNCCS